MSVSAAANSQVLATAPAPKRLHFGEMGAYEQKQKAMGARAFELLEAAGGLYASQEQETEIHNTLKAEFGIDEHRARSFVTGAWSAISKKAFGSSNAHLRNTPATFTSPEAAKALARDKMDQVEYGVQLYNIGVKSWSTEGILKERQESWQKAFAKRLENNGGDEADAIKFAEEHLKKTIEVQSSGSGDNYQLRLGLGGLQAGFGALPANLIVENKDGTLSINYDSLKNTTLGNLLNIGSHLGQEVDKAA